MFYNKNIVSNISNPTPTEPLENASGIEGVTNREYDAIMGLIDEITRTSDVRYSVGGAQRFNRVATKAIFGNHGSDKWDHNGHFNRAKEVVRAMVVAGEILPIYNDMFAIVGIKLPEDEILPDHPELAVDPHKVLLMNTMGQLAAAAERLAAETRYHEEADEMIGPLSDENEQLSTENAALRARIDDLEHSPREAEMQAELEELRQQLAKETAAREAAERRVDFLQSSLSGAKEKTKATESIARGKDRQIKGLNRTVSDLRAESQRQVDEAFKEGEAKGWGDGIYTLCSILTEAGYRDDSAKVAHALAHTGEEIYPIYKKLSDITFVIEQLETLDSGRTKSIVLPSGEPMPATNSFQIDAAKTRLVAELSSLRTAMRNDIDAIVSAQDVSTNNEVEHSPTTV